MDNNNIIRVGIDLGTTFSSVSILNERGIETIQINGETKSLPSVLYLSNTECLIGSQALNREINGEYVVHEVKRFLGKTFTIPDDDQYKKEEHEIRKRFSNLIEMNDGLIGIEIERKATLKDVRSTIQLLPEEISALVLMRLKYKIEKKYPGKQIKAIVGIPAIFGDEQRMATMNAIKMAGIDLIKLFNEPTAAAKVYIENLKNNPEFIEEEKERKELIRLANEHPEEYDLPSNRIIFVYDFGGGTLDISIVDIDSNRVIGTYGNPLLGGNNLDANVEEWLTKRIKEELDSIGMEDDDINKLIKKKKGLISDRRSSLFKP